MGILENIDFKIFTIFQLNLACGYRNQNPDDRQYYEIERCERTCHASYAAFSRNNGVWIPLAAYSGNKHCKTVYSTVEIWDFRRKLTYYVKFSIILTSFGSNFDVHDGGRFFADPWHEQKPQNLHQTKQAARMLNL